jgi:hypothetical protein
MINLFVSAPMSTVSPKEYASFREQIMDLIALLRELLKNPDIYYSGQAIRSHGQFDTPAHSFQQDTEALDRCTVFTLVYPGKTVTSALVELGYALKMKVPIVIITSDRKDLPYMVRELDQAIRNAIIIEYGNNNMIQHVKNNNFKLSDFFSMNL